MWKTYCFSRLLLYRPDCGNCPRTSTHSPPVRPQVARLYHKYTRAGLIKQDPNSMKLVPAVEEDEHDRVVRDLLRQRECVFFFVLIVFVPASCVSVSREYFGLALL